MVFCGYDSWSPDKSCFIIFFATTLCIFLSCIEELDLRVWVPWPHLHMGWLIKRVFLWRTLQICTGWWADLLSSPLLPCPSFLCSGWKAVIVVCLLENLCLAAHCAVVLNLKVNICLNPPGSMKGCGHFWGLFAGHSANAQALLLGELSWKIPSKPYPTVPREGLWVLSLLCFLPAVRAGWRKVFNSARTDLTCHSSTALEWSHWSLTAISSFSSRLITFDLKIYLGRSLKLELGQVVDVFTGLGLKQAQGPRQVRSPRRPQVSLLRILLIGSFLFHTLSVVWDAE